MLFMSIRHILMADIIKSRKADSKRLQNNFAEIVSAANRSFKGNILSPLTITLGDELQGVISDLRTSLDIIYYLEEVGLELKLKFKLRYVLHSGEIDTPINPERAHGMLGHGLAEARKILSHKYRGKPRFQMALPDQQLTTRMNHLWKLLENLQEDWKPRDYPLIHAMIWNDNNREVGELFGKNASQIWKRRNTLRIEDYCLIKKLLYDLVT